jgi:hypothetical protein
MPSTPVELEGKMNKREKESAPAVHPMSDYEKFIFDLKGVFVIPGVLSADELATVRAHTDAYSRDHDNLPEHHRAPMAGPAEFLSFSSTTRASWASYRK